MSIKKIRYGASAKQGPFLAKKLTNSFVLRCFCFVRFSSVFIIVRFAVHLASAFCDANETTFIVRKAIDRCQLPLDSMKRTTAPSSPVIITITRTLSVGVIVRTARVRRVLNCATRPSSIRHRRTSPKLLTLKRNQEQLHGGCRTSGGKSAWTA